MLLRDSVICVTGGSRGFGFAIAQCLLARGCRVGLIGRSQASLDAAMTSLDTEAAFAVAADVGDKAGVSTALDAIGKHFMRFDALVNNAGLGRPNAVENLSESEVLLQVNTNFLGTVFACQAAIPLLRGAADPRIVNISSASAWHYDEMSHLSIYAATKAAVERFSRDLRTELQPDNIGVTCIRPGFVWTSFADGWDEAAIKTGIDAWQGSGPLMSIGMEVQQVADAVAYALEQPPGVAVDLLEVRPNQLTPKLKNT